MQCDDRLVLCGKLPHTGARPCFYCSLLPDPRSDRYIRLVRIESFEQGAGRTGVELWAELIMRSRIQFGGVALVLLVLAVALRFHGLGSWPFAGDEVATLREDQVMFHGAQASQESQTYRLPHLIPLGYAVLHLSHTFFGSDEFGSRVLLAILGGASVLLVFLALDGLLGRPTAIAVSILTALWPEHVFQSQQTRFYIVVAFFSFLSVLCGALTLKRKPVLYSSLSCCFAIAATLSHTAMAVLLPMVFSAIVSGWYADRKPVPRAVLTVFSMAAVVMTLLFIFHVLPLMRGWNQGETWGYSTAHAVLGAVVMIGWPVVLLTAIGTLLMFSERNAQNWYWITCLFGFATGTIVFPSVTAFHMAYLFPLALAVLVVAGFAIGTIYTRLREKSMAAAVAWLGLACLVNLPTLVSHYVDGSRWDLRSAAQFIKKNWTPGDRVTGSSMGTFRYYASGCCEPIIPQSLAAVPQLKELTKTPGRLWIVVQYGRGGLPEDTQRWLFDNCAKKLQVRGKRFDYHEHTVDVFLFTH